VPFNKAKFDQYTVNIDISNIGNFNPDEEKFKTGRQMLSLKQINFYTDSLIDPYKNYIRNKARRIYLTLRANKLYQDTIPHNDLKPDILSNFDEENQMLVTDNAAELAKNNLDVINSYKEVAKGKQKIINSYHTEFHKRPAYSLACIVLFFIGAPIGSIIRKGGFGLPMILAIIIFVFYFFLNTLGDKMAQSNKISPVLGGWMATIILLPLGYLLMRRATRDKGIFNIDLFFQPVKDFFTKLFKLKKS